MNRILALFALLFLIQVSYAAPLGALVTIDDGLNHDEPKTQVDDYVRLQLMVPNYQTAVAIDKAITEWLGPGMVRLENNALVLVQAPRDAHRRVQFIAALLALEVSTNP